jgi:hypothetical protein
MFLTHALTTYFHRGKSDDHIKQQQLPTTRRATERAYIAGVVYVFHVFLLSG